MAFASDVRFAFRVVGRRPGVPLLIAGLFALSIGLSGGLWAVVDAVALRPLPYPDAHELVAVMERHPERGLMSVTPANFWDWVSRVSTLPYVVGLGGLEASLVGRGVPVRVVGTRVTEQFFDVMAVAPARGRAFSLADFRGDGRVVILTDGLWERHFVRDSKILGAPVMIDGESYTVVGIMPRDFKTIGNSEIWVPWIMSAKEQAERRFHLVGVMARLQPGRSAADAERELQAIYGQLQANHADTTAHWTAQVTPLRDLMLGDSRQALLILGTAVFALLVIASINVVGLLLAWLSSRRQEFLVRVALGASIGRVVRQVLTESMMYAAGGMLGGVLLALAFVQLFGAVGLSPSLEYDFGPRIDARAIVAMAILLVVATVATTLTPALASGRRADLVPRRASSTGSRGQQLAIAVQVALSLVLLCTAATLLTGFQRLARLAGPEVVSLLGVDISLSESRYRDEQSQRQFFDHLLDALATRQEVRTVAAASYVPPARIYGNYRFEIEGRATASDALTTLASATSPGLFRMLGISVLRGRAIEDRDGAAASRVGVISAALARRYWANDDPVGHRITLVGDVLPITIVGVVDDVRQPLSGDPRAESVLYLPYRQVPWPFMTILLQPTAAVAPALAAVREEVGRLDPSQATGQARPIDEIRREWLMQPRLRTQIVVLFGVSALFLTLVGLYARVSYSVGCRTREFAIRQAVGARPVDVIRSMTGEALLVVFMGIVVGLTLLPAVNSSVQGIVSGLPPAGLLLTASVAALFALLAVGSAYGPARRAGRTNPAEALRAE